MTPNISNGLTSDSPNKIKEWNKMRNWKFQKVRKQPSQMENGNKTKRADWSNTLRETWRCFAAFYMEMLWKQQN